MSLLVAKLRTKEDLDLLQGELDILEKSIYQTNNKYDDILRNDIRNWVADTVSEELKTTSLDLPGYIKSVRNEISDIPVLSMAINFEPSMTFIEQISAWLKKNINNNIVVDIMLNASILGGLQLSFKGKYLDLSLRKKISKELENYNLSIKY